MIRIISSIFKSKTSRVGVWSVSTSAIDTTADPSRRHITGQSDFAKSFAEAIQAATDQRAAIDRELMDTVHASRASRRSYKVDCIEVPLFSPCDCQECDDARAFVEATA